MCDDTPALFYDTSITWAGTSLFSALALVLVLRHFCQRGGGGGGGGGGG